MTYAARIPSTNSDGTPLFASDYDKAAEAEVRAVIEREWNCDLHHFGRLCPVDFYAIRDGRLVGLVEVKSRSHASDKFPTVFLNVRKWLALSMAQSGLGVPAMFVVRFTDGVRFIPVGAVNASAVRIGGAAAVVKSHTDIEPVIEVPVAEMRRFGGVAP